MLQKVFFYSCFPEFKIAVVLFNHYSVSVCFEAGNSSTHRPCAVVENRVALIRVGFYEPFQKLNGLFCSVKRNARVWLCKAENACRVFLCFARSAVVRCVEFSIIAIDRLFFCVSMPFAVQWFTLCKLRVIDGLSFIEDSNLLMPAERHSLCIEEARRKFLIPYKVVAEHLQIALREFYVKLPLCEERDTAV